MTTRQVLRGLGRTARAMDTAARRAERRAATARRSADRAEALRSAAAAAAGYDREVGDLTGMHRVAVARRDWRSSAAADSVEEPVRGDDAERAALAEADAWRPGWLTRAVGLEGRARRRLNAAVAAARSRDDADYESAVARVAAARAAASFARRVLEREPDAVVEALESFSSLGAMPPFVTGLETLFDGGRLAAVVEGPDLEEVPAESVTLLASGRASVRRLPDGRRHEMYRDAVCSCAVRVAAEYLGALQLDVVDVLVLATLLDPATGRLEEVPVLRLRVAAQALELSNLAHAEASALCERLGGVMRWNRRNGFAALPVDVRRTL